MRRLGGEVWQRASGITDRPSRRAPESSEGRDARRADLVAWPAGLDVAGRGLARGQTFRKPMWVMVSPWQGGPTPAATGRHPPPPTPPPRVIVRGTNALRVLISLPDTA